jgi:hypothetical protein
VAGLRFLSPEHPDLMKNRILQQPVKTGERDLDSIVVIGLNLSYIVNSANESQLDATGHNVKAL